MLKFLKSVRRGLDQSAFLALTASAAAVALPVCVVAEEPLITNVLRFEIPFDIETDSGQRPEGFAVLFGSQDGGATGKN
ncbi:MAG: hypothetical protein WKF77_21895 [Planctomycetaceae bacterium]